MVNSHLFKTIIMIKMLLQVRWWIFKSRRVAMPIKNPHKRALLKVASLQVPSRATSNLVPMSRCTLSKETQLVRESWPINNMIKPGKTCSRSRVSWILRRLLPWVKWWAMSWFRRLKWKSRSNSKIYKISITVTLISSLKRQILRSRPVQRKRKILSIS